MNLDRASLTASLLVSKNSWILYPVICGDVAGGTTAPSCLMRFSIRGSLVISTFPCCAKSVPDARIEMSIVVNFMSDILSCKCI